MTGTRPSFHGNKSLMDFLSTISPEVKRRQPIVAELDALYAKARAMGIDVDAEKEMIRSLITSLSSKVADREALVQRHEALHEQFWNDAVRKEFASRMLSQSKILRIDSLAMFHGMTEEATPEPIPQIYETPEDKPFTKRQKTKSYKLSQKRNVQAGSTKKANAQAFVQRNPFCKQKQHYAGSNMFDLSKYQ